MYAGAPQLIAIGGRPPPGITGTAIALTVLLANHQKNNTPPQFTDVAPSPWATPRCSSG